MQSWIQLKPTTAAREMWTIGDRDWKIARLLGCYTVWELGIFVPNGNPNENNRLSGRLTALAGHSTIAQTTYGIQKWEIETNWLNDYNSEKNIDGKEEEKATKNVGGKGKGRRRHDSSSYGPQQLTCAPCTLHYQLQAESLATGYGTRGPMLCKW